VQRLQAETNVIDAKIAQAKVSPTKSTSRPVRIRLLLNLFNFGHSRKSHLLIVTF
jgi:hypothetical protein